MRVAYHPEAEAELIAAARFYEKRVANLGGRFLDAADRAIAVIQGARTLANTGSRCPTLPNAKFSLCGL